MAEEPPSGRSFRIVPLSCASLTIALGLLTLIGWVSGLPLLASVRAKYIPMAPSTALCFSLIGIGLITHILKSTLRWIPRAAGCVVLVIAIAKLVEISAGFTLVSTPGLFVIRNYSGRFRPGEWHRSQRLTSFSLPSPYLR